MEKLENSKGAKAIPFKIKKQELNRVKHIKIIAVNEKLFFPIQKRRGKIVMGKKIKNSLFKFNYYHNKCIKDSINFKDQLTYERVV